MALLPTGVTIVTASGGDGPAGATANAVTSLSLDPPLMLACLERGSRTLAALAESERFAINVLRAEHAGLARSFAGPYSHAERFAEVPWTDRHGLPVLDEALLWVACELADRHDGGDHAILVGRVVALGADTGADPLVFHRGAYRGLEGGH